MNVCTPWLPEQLGLSSALARVPKQPAFSPGFERDGSREMLDPGANPLPRAGIEPARSSSCGGEMAPAQSVRARNPKDQKDQLELAIGSRGKSVTTTSGMVAAGTSTRRIKLERFAKTIRRSATLPEYEPRPGAGERIRAGLCFGILDPSKFPRAGGARRQVPEEPGETDRLAGSSGIRPGCDRTSFPESKRGLWR